MTILHVKCDNPIHGVSKNLISLIVNAQKNSLESEFKSAKLLCQRVFDDTRLNVSVPDDLKEKSARFLADKSFSVLVQYFTDLLKKEKMPDQPIQLNAINLSQRLQLVTAFEDPDKIIREVREKVNKIVEGFPKRASDIEVGRNPGDVIDPYILAATQILMYGGDFEPAIEATVAHKVLMMIEGLMGHLHEDVIGAMRGNVRIPEPRGKDQETLDPKNNPFPGADVLQPPRSNGEKIRFHQLKSKTGSAKGGDGRRLGEQLQRLQNMYDGEIFYHALIGNTLRGHRSRAGVEKAAPSIRVLVGEASFEELTSSLVGPQLLLRLYQSTFMQVSDATGYRVDTIAAGIVATFKERAEREGEGFLEVILKGVTGGSREQQDNRHYKPR